METHDPLTPTDPLAAPPLAREGRVHLDQHRKVAYLEWNWTSPLKLLALHGWLDNAASFSGLAPLLPEVHLVALDLPGHGRSSHKHPSAVYHLVDWVYDVLDVWDALGWGPGPLMGHSMGAGVSPLVAAADPERVTRLILIEGLGPHTSEPDDVPRRIREHWQKRREPQREKTRQYPDIDLAVRARQTSAPLADAAARALVTRNLEVAPGGYRWASDPRLRWPSPLPFTQAHALRLLEEVRCPTLVVEAEDGTPYEEGDLTSRLSRLADVRHEVVPGRHHVHLEDPALVAPLVRAFLNL